MAKTEEKYSFDGSNVYLRRLTEDDINEEYLSWFQDEVVQEFTDAGTRAMTREEVIAYVSRGQESEEYDMYAIIAKDTDKHVGNIKMGPINHKHRVSDLSTFIGDRSYWGKGIATDAIKIGNELAFKKYKIRKLCGPIVSTNKGSIKAYTRAGWVIEATLAGHFTFGGESQEQVIVSCFNPEYFEEKDGKYYPTKI